MPEKDQEHVAVLPPEMQPGSWGQEEQENGFVFASYRKEVKRSESVMYDGVLEMMDLRQFRHFAAKPKMEVWTARMLELSSTG